MRHQCTFVKYIIVSHVVRQSHATSRAHVPELGYAGYMLLNGREAILNRVQLLKAEVSDIQRLNEQYSQQRRTLPAQQNHAQRRGRLEQIVEELKALTNRKIQ
jgi:hypothetical protein